MTYYVFMSLQDMKSVLLSLVINKSSSAYLCKKNLKFMKEKITEHFQPKDGGAQRKRKIWSPRCAFLLASTELQIKICYRNVAASNKTGFLI